MENNNYECENTNFLSQIQTEPVDNTNLSNEEPFIKTVLGDCFDAANIVQHYENIEVKVENTFNSVATTTEKPGISSTENDYLEREKNEFDKITMSGNNYPKKEAFSKSPRVRKQFEPDSDNESDNAMSLLIPITCNSLLTETTQNVCAGNSSDKEPNSIQKSMPKKKKYVKQKIKQKSFSRKKKSTEGQNLLSIKKVHDLAKNQRINEEEKVKSSDSDSIKSPRKRINKFKIKRCLQKGHLIVTENELQCNNVDSTQNESENNEFIDDINKIENFDVNIEGNGASNKMHIDEQAECSGGSFLSEINQPVTVEHLLHEFGKDGNDTSNLQQDSTLKELKTSNDNNIKSSKFREGENERKKNTTKQDRTSLEDDSPYKEKKQCFNTTEKLLKTLEKTEDGQSLGESKRTKKVVARRKMYRRACARMALKRIVKERKCRVVSKKLFDETSKSRPHRRKGFQSFTKGRRSIKKNIDNKSLACSTLTVNVEENERKRRLHERLTVMREKFHCEEGVNVVVINDELCLEYDFEANVSIVSIHNSFTSVMKPHQYEGVKFMWDACFESLAMIESGHTGGGCILSHCMGLGKTLQVLALLHTVLTHPRINMKRVLVCCPLSTVLNWVDEVHRWMKPPILDQIKIFEITKLKKIRERAQVVEEWYKDGGIFIINYELFRNLATLDAVADKIHPTIIKKFEKCLLDPGPDVIICDEGQVMKNDSSVLAVAMNRVATKRRIVLTGTPIQNNLREYYCMVNFVKPNLLGHYSEFSSRFENTIMDRQHRDSREGDMKVMKERTHILHEVLEGVMQRKEASILYSYLPEKHEYTLFIPLSKCQCDLYKHYLTHYAQDNHKTLRDFNILQKIWSHPQVLHNIYSNSRDENTNKNKAEKLEDELVVEDQMAATEDAKSSNTRMWWLQYLEEGKLLNTLESSNKFLVVFRILQECMAFDDKVLIFSTSLFTMDTLEYFLKKINKWSLGSEYYRLDGSVPADIRQEWCRDFNAENNNTTKLFLISSRAGSLGLNMTAANRVIIFDTSWNPAHDIQSMFRVYRFGQKKECYIYRLIALGTMEQKIYERSVTQQAVACREVDEQQIDRLYNMTDLNELYKFDETGADVACGVSAGVTDVVLLRVARDAPLHAVHEHDTLLRVSKEQQLQEHEREAACSQFEKEQYKYSENLVNSSQKVTTKRRHEPDNAKSLSIDTNGEEESDAKRCKRDSTCLDEDPVKNEHHHKHTNDTNFINQIINNLDIKTDLEHMITKVKNILEARFQHLSDVCCTDDTLGNRLRIAMQSTINDTVSSIVQPENHNQEVNKALDTCSVPETNNETNKTNNQLNENETDLQMILCSDEDDVIFLNPESDEQQNNNTQEFHDEQVILLSDAETITDDEQAEEITETQVCPNVENDKDVNCIVLIDDENGDVNINTNEPELMTIDITETNDDMADNDDNITTHKPKLLPNVADTHSSKNSILDKNKALEAMNTIFSSSLDEVLKETSKTGEDSGSEAIYDVAVNSKVRFTLKQIRSSNKGKASETNTSTPEHNLAVEPCNYLADTNPIDLTTDDDILTGANENEKAIPKDTLGKVIREKLDIVKSEIEKTIKNTRILSTMRANTSNMESILIGSTSISYVPLPSPSTNAVDTETCTSKDKRNSSIPLRSSDDHRRHSSSAFEDEEKRPVSYDSKTTSPDIIEIEDTDDVIELE